MATLNETATENTANSRVMPLLQYTNDSNFSKGRDVAYLQYLLISYYPELTIEVDGKYGLKTKEAVTKFQKDRNQLSDVNPTFLNPDGVVGHNTWRALGDNFYRTCKTSIQNPLASFNYKGNDNDLLLLKRQNNGKIVKGEAVRFLQQLLLGYTEITGYTNDSFDGEFNQETEDAVKAFQRNSGLQDDGEVGPLTWTKLFEGSSIRCNGTVS
jgi:peptidoglycan hydrolase-like protein with peptidoglycan-binding domain